MPSWLKTGAVIAALALCAVILVVPTDAASAHEQLLSSSPAPDERLASPPPEVRLEFTADILGLGAVVLVMDGDGTDWAVGEAQVDGPVVTIAVDPDIPVGGYEVRWRVVSGDGHPISDIIPFTIGDAEPLVVDRSGSGSGQQTTHQAGVEEAFAILRTLLIAVGGALAAGGAFALITLLGRRRAHRADDPPLASSDDEHKH